MSDAIAFFDVPFAEYTDHERRARPRRCLRHRLRHRAVP